MTDKYTITFECEKDLANLFDSVADSLKTDRSKLIRKAMKQFLVVSKDEELKERIADKLYDAQLILSFEMKG